MKNFEYRHWLSVLIKFVKAIVRKKWNGFRTGKNIEMLVLLHIFSFAEFLIRVDNL